MRLCVRVRVFKEGNLRAESSESKGKTGECMQRELVFFHYVGYAAVTNLECVLISLSH